MPIVISWVKSGLTGRGMVMDESSDERGFLHNLASPVSTALFLADSMVDSLQSRPGTPPDDLAQIIGIYEALERIRTLLQERRNVLIERGAPSARS